MTATPDRDASPTDPRLAPDAAPTTIGQGQPDGTIHIGGHLRDAAARPPQ